MKKITFLVTALLHGRSGGPMKVFRLTTAPFSASR